MLILSYISTLFYCFWRRNHNSYAKVDKIMQNNIEGEQINSEPKRRSGELPDKQFLLRNSRLTELGEKNMNYQSLQHIIGAGLLTWVVSAAVSAYIDNKGLTSILPDLDYFIDAFSNYQIGIFLWFQLMTLTLVFYLIVRFWAQFRSKTPIITAFDRTFVVVYLAYLAFFAWVSYDVLFRKTILGPAMATAVSLEQVRLVAKMHSFAREIGKKMFSTKKDDDNAFKPWKFPKFIWYVYFLFAPTLIYRESYPRTQSINWGNVFVYFTQFFACIILFYYIFHRYIMAEFLAYSAQSLTGPVMIKLIVLSIAPAGAMWVFFFYGFFQAWLNAWAELLRFGDRLFYDDWWNSRDTAEMLRKWNIVVHDWLYIYVYKESYDWFKSKKSKVLPSILCFAASSAFHEFVMVSMLKFVFPTMFIMLSIFGNASIFNKVQHFGRFNRFYMATMSIFVSWGIMVSLYLFEYQARLLCPNANPRYFEPRFWSCFGAPNQ